VRISGGVASSSSLSYGVEIQTVMPGSRQGRKKPTRRRPRPKEKLPRRQKQASKKELGYDPERVLPRGGDGPCRGQARRATNDMQVSNPGETLGEMLGGLIMTRTV
jgi:hypothetical protein